MPEKRTMERARRAKRQGKAASTQAGEFVREEIHHVREGKHGARSAKQVIAIGLSKARRARVRTKRPGTAARRAAASTSGRRGSNGHGATPRRDAAAARGRASASRAQASSRALKRETRSAASHTALARQGRASAKRRNGAQRSAAARRASRTQGATQRSAEARKAARTRGEGRTRS